MFPSTREADNLVPVLERKSVNFDIHPIQYLGLPKFHKWVFTWGVDSGSPEKESALLGEAMKQ